MEPEWGGDSQVAVKSFGHTGMEYGDLLLAKQTGRPHSWSLCGYQAPDADDCAILVLMNPTPVNPDEESRRLARLLGGLLKLDHRSVRSVEQDLGLGSSALGKVLNGNIRLQVSHIFMVLNVLEMTPAQFFHTVYPRKPALHRLTQELREAQGLPAVDEPNDPELEAKIKRILLRILSGLLRAEGFALEPPAETT